MEKDIEQLLERLTNFECESQWESIVSNYIDQTHDSPSQQTDTPTPEKFRVTLHNKMKELVGSFIKKYIKKLKESKSIVDLQNDNIHKLRADVGCLKEENEQLNEMSLRLISQIKRLKKYTNESDILGSILRGEIYKQRHQNKMLLNALKELYDGNEELATKILANAFSEEQNSADNSHQRMFNSPEVRKRQLSMEENDISLLQRDLTMRGTRSAKSKRHARSAGVDDIVAYSAKEFSIDDEASSPGVLVVKEEDELSENMGYDSSELHRDFKEIGDKLNKINSYDSSYSNNSDKNISLSLPRVAEAELGSIASSEISPYRHIGANVPMIKNILSGDNMLDKSLIAKDINMARSEFLTFNFCKMDDDFDSIPIIKLDRVPRWLKSEASLGVSRKLATIGEKPRAKNELIEIEDKIDFFVNVKKSEAGLNTEIPLADLMKMPISTLVDMFLNIFSFSHFPTFVRSQ